MLTQLFLTTVQTKAWSEMFRLSYNVRASCFCNIFAAQIKNHDLKSIEQARIEPIRFREFDKPSTRTEQYKTLWHILQLLLSEDNFF